MDIEQNPYACLGLMPGSSPAEIKTRYRQLAKQYHPDCNGQTAHFEEKLRRLNAAYGFLSDPARKAAYDAADFPKACATPSVFPACPIAVPTFFSWRTRSNSLCAVAGLTVLLILTSGFGMLFTAANAAPSLTGLFPQVAGTADTGPDFPAPAFSFLPVHGTFDSPNSTNAGGQETAR